MRLFRSESILESDEFFDIAATTAQSQIATMVLEPGQTSGEFGTEHPDSDQILIVLRGVVDAKVGAETVSLFQGDTILIEAGEQHQIVGSGEQPAKTLNLYAPAAYPA